MRGGSTAVGGNGERGGEGLKLTMRLLSGGSSTMASSSSSRW
jgi:hypothetical protein